MWAGWALPCFRSAEPLVALPKKEMNGSAQGRLPQHPAGSSLALGRSGQVSASRLERGLGTVKAIPALNFQMHFKYLGVGSEICWGGFKSC